MPDRRIPLIMLPLFLGVITILLTGTFPAGSPGRSVLTTTASLSFVLAFGQLLLWTVIRTGRFLVSK